MGTEAREFRAHPLRIFPEVQNKSIFEEVAPLRVYALEGDVVLESLAIAFKDGAKDLRQREDRRAQVETETLRLKLIELAPYLRVFLKDSDLEAIARQHDGRGQSAKSGSDDDNAFGLRGSRHDPYTKVILIVCGLLLSRKEHSSKSG